MEECPKNTYDDYQWMQEINPQSSASAKYKRSPKKVNAPNNLSGGKQI